MRKLLLIAIVTLFTFSAHAEKSKLSVLYVGINPDKQDGPIKGYGSKEIKAEKLLRWADFKQFLNKHFEKVGMVHSTDYKQSMSDNYDVTVFDGRPKPIKEAVRDRKPDGTYIYEPAEFLTEGYSSATLSISQQSRNLGESLKTKFDWC